jgi:ribosomal protein S27E
MTDFKYGDLTIKCHQCGLEQVIEELVTDGRAIYLFNNHNSFIKLHCPDCDITMEMSLKPNDVANKEIEDNVEDIVPDEELPQESPTEETV